MAKDTNKKEKDVKKDQKSNFMKDLRVELKKVTWPTRKELISSTATVIFISILIAAIVFVLDFTFEKANTYGVDKLKSIVSSNVEENLETVPEATTEGNTDGNAENNTPEVAPESSTGETNPETVQNPTENTAE